MGGNEIFFHTIVGILSTLGSSFITTSSLLLFEVSLSSLMFDEGLFCDLVSTVVESVEDPVESKAEVEI